MKIAQIAPLWFPIPPKKYGGTERVIHYLTEELVKRKHKVTLFASGNSKTSAKLFSVTKKNLISRKIPWQDFWWNNLNYSLVFQKAKNFDIIHSHWTPLGIYFQKFTKTPVLHTLHNIPPKNDHRWEIFRYFKDSNVVFLSKKEKKNSPIRFKKEYIVYNGIDISQFKFNSKPKDCFVWIGRVCQKKGIKNAILVAKKLGIKLILAGQLQPMYEDYFKREIKPYLNEKIKYIGELSQKELSLFYGQAKAFIYPIEWEEPFGLCMAEAMACGTPVVAFNRGSVPEVVKDGKTGFVVKNIKEAVKAIKNIDKIKRKDCRLWVEENFTIKKMVDNYEKIYYHLIK
ncbi:hypothetical protein AMJ49_02130 [Parcubacteria bacterium DG_74_2]|nr:MAG: hypothetical protein AMJ49_02130 [Parcubacteria bacterium DG_74_2]